VYCQCELLLLYFRVYDEYSFQVIPVLGQILASDWNSYQYLVESIRQFPNQVSNSCSLVSNKVLKQKKTWLDFLLEGIVHSEHLAVISV